MAAAASYPYCSTGGGVADAQYYLSRLGRLRDPAAGTFAWGGVGHDTGHLVSGYHAKVARWGASRR